MNDVYIFEDHDRALKVWRKKNLRSLDLVHVDAHMDFGFTEAEPLDTVLEQSKSVAELKKKLEYSIAFSSFEKDFSKQINIGNYIYPAMCEGIVKNFYWVIPGAGREFRASKKILINFLRKIMEDSGAEKNIYSPAENTIVMEVLGRQIYICTLVDLPFINDEVLLDIDTDFLVIDSVKNSDNITHIGARKPWITPVELAGMLKNKIPKPKLVTIAYSVNGGYTPMKYRHLGDELAFLFAPGKFKRKYARNKEAAGLFNAFELTNKKKYYQSAVRLNNVYRQADNNYGYLYLGLKKYSRAEKEFLRIRKVEPGNPANLTGRGLLALEKKNFQKAKEYFSKVLKAPKSRMFCVERARSLLGLAEAEYGLKNLSQAKRLLEGCLKKQPLESGARYLSGRIFEEEKDFSRAMRFYQCAAQLGFGGLDVSCRMAKILLHFREKDSIINCIRGQVKRFKEEKDERYSKKEKKQLAFIEKMINC